MHRHRAHQSIHQVDTGIVSVKLCHLVGKSSQVCCRSHSQDSGFWYFERNQLGMGHGKLFQCLICSSNMVVDWCMQHLRCWHLTEHTSMVMLLNYHLLLLLGPFRPPLSIDYQVDRNRWLSHHSLSSSLLQRLRQHRSATTLYPTSQRIQCRCTRFHNTNTQPTFVPRGLLRNLLPKLQATVDFQDLLQPKLLRQLRIFVWLRFLTHLEGNNSY
jgi:hypothetical protein